MFDNKYFFIFSQGIYWTAGVPIYFTRFAVPGKGKIISLKKKKQGKKLILS